MIILTFVHNFSNGKDLPVLIKEIDSYEETTNSEEDDRSLPHTPTKKGEKRKLDKLLTKYVTYN